MKVLSLLILIVSVLLFGSVFGNVGRGVMPTGSAKSNNANNQNQQQPIASQAGSSSDLWQDIDAKSLPTIRIRQQHGPRSFRSLRLNTESMKALLRRAPAEALHSISAEKVTLEVPRPDGGFMRFNIEDSPIMEPELASRYPEIKTYRGQGVDDPTATARFDYTQFGFHAIILTTKGSILIEPDSLGDVTNYVVYFNDQIPQGIFECDTDDSNQAQDAVQHDQLKRYRDGIRPNVFSGTSLRTYRLAVATTAEYTQAYGGGTVGGGLAAVTTTMNFVNGIYEREVAIRMVLVANNDQIIFTDTNTDGYTSDIPGTLITQNQTKLDAVIGSANYDIGHVFDGRILSGGSFSWRGLAQIASVCDGSRKAQGVSIARSLQPSNTYQIYSVSHEMGHQFGASHTFNATSGECLTARSSITAYEPGTGSTIMGYRLNCSPEDQGSTDHYFHIASLEQITAFTTTGTGSTCAMPTATGNNVPTVSTGPNFTIPQGTPFALTAIANDPDGDALTYCWEEYDLGPGGPPFVDDGAKPIFRSYAPDANPTRTFVRGAQLGITSMPWELLPTTTRTMRFRVTVRDNHSGGGAANSADTQLNVRSDAGPFTVTAPTNGAVWTTNSTQTVTWNVANTNNAPVSCSSVKISLSIDGLGAFPIILASDTPNDGSETVTIPGTPSAGLARINVEAVGNVFFNVSGQFSINGSANSTPTISSFTPNTGAPGTQVTIQGTNFITPSSVTFNGVSATFTVKSTTEITATVPNGVTTGPIAVTTPSGTATSASNFLAPISYAVSGRLADAGNNGIANATVTFLMNFQGTLTTSTTTTDASGNYQSGDLGCQNSVLVTPSKVGISFTPIAQNFVSSNCLTGTATANFTGAPSGPNSIQFSSSNYNVSESSPSLTVTVTRTGDTSGTSTVDYITTDVDNFTVNCGNIAGNAFARCDYATSVDTLTFGPTVTSRTFQIPIINDGWAEGNETFGVVLSNANGGTLGNPATTVVTINDNETVNGPNPIFSTPFFVRQQYIDFLSREPEVGEPWTAVLNGCSDVNNNPACDRITVSGAFFGSPEFQLKGGFVYRFYKVAFNRLPLYTEIVIDMRAVTGATPAEVFAKKATFTNNFVLRPEFANLYNAMNNTQYVSTLMGRYTLTSITTPDPANPDGNTKVTLTNTDLVNRLNGVGGTLTRAQVLRAIADSDEVFNAEFNRSFVAMQYFGYLRRNPDTAGYQAWLDYLNTHPGDSRTMVNGFMNSQEYWLRFGPLPTP